MVFLPCFVESVPFDTTEVPSEFVGGNPLSFGVVAQDIDKMIEVPIIVDDGLLGPLKGCYKGFSSSDLPLSPGMPTSKDSISNSYGNSDGPTDDSKDYWCLYFTPLLMWYGSWLSIKTMQRNIRLK
jgi:hypothetical protein